MMPSFTCPGICHPLCKNNCPLNKHIWVRDYIEPPPELELIIEINKLKHRDVDFLKVRAPNRYQDLRVQYKIEKERKKELNKLLMEEGFIEGQVAPRRLPKPGETSSRYQ